MKRILSVFTLASCLALSAPAVELHDLQLHMGEFLIVNTYHEDASGNTVQGSDVSPLIFAPGIAGRLDFNPYWRFRPEIRFYWQEYLFTDEDKAAPTQPETGTAVGDIGGTLGVLLRFPWVYEWYIEDTWTIGAGFSPTMHLRFPMAPVGGSDLDGLYRYFYSSARFLSPEFHGYMSYRVSDAISVGFSLSSLIPWHNWWTDFDTEFRDESLFSFSATIHYALGQ